MRGAIGRRFSNPNGFTIASIVKQTPFLTQSTFHFSSSSDSAGRGRGRGSDGGFPAAGRGQFGVNRESEKASEPVVPGRESSSAGGYGHGRGRPIQSDSISPAFSSFVRPDSSSVGRGRGSVGSDSVSPFAAEPSRHSPPPPPPPQQQQSQSQQQRSQPQQQPRSQPQPNDESQGSPVFVKLQEMKDVTSSPPAPESKSGQTDLPDNVFNALGSEIPHSSGAGRGKPLVESAPIQREENRHIRRPPPPPQQQRSQPQQKRAQTPRDETPRPRLSAEEAGRRARSELSRGEAEGSGVRGRGGRGRGRGARGRGRGRGGEGWRDDKKEEEGEQEAMSVFAGDSADGEKFANKMGPELMKTLAEGFEEVCEKALPSTTHDAIIDAYDTNLMIECEPEYIMPDFGSNPDIDEKPPMSLRECLEKVKPFIVAYEGIKDQEEWEEAINEAMAQAPLMKEIVDHYSGPDRVTAKKQNEELDRIATTLPKSAPDSVKRFADRAALTLKSNPGWGFDKKYQFMDKLVLEVSQSYK
ncbi:hypothetical protein CARUB_v10008838mg [Capsella rubella]|uniref:Hydroxyproline-rich glycoprotein family protein n=1 Tax=Capsella rubella TaxID=81985 RepID=R0GWF7_9BRAS|nr:uncharacterized protein LOC17898084 [Capsella rubella]EOA40131.1 hypothetical protein CARUB_v10008838mg [Capsella rubella]